MAGIFNKDERAAKRLLRRGNASVGEILKLSFGEWPPRGLDINPFVRNTQKVTLKSYFNKAVVQGLRASQGRQLHRSLWSRVKGIVQKVKNTWGMSNISGERVIWVNKILTSFIPRLKGKSLVMPTLGHEAIHALQGDNSYRAQEIYGAQASNIRREQSGTRSEVIMTGLKNYDARFAKDAVAEAFNSTVSRGMMSYLKTGDETQAFFHEALADGYKQWGRLPGNEVELWQALVSLGLMPPAFIYYYLRENPVAAFAAPVAMNTAAQNLAKINMSLSPQGQELFWRTSLPALYADLIEMYGDRYGRERFDLGHNTKGDIQEAVFGTDHRRALLPLPRSPV